MLHRCSRYGMASCFPSHGSSGSRGMQRVLPQCDIGELFFPSLLVLSLWMSKGHAPMVDESGRPVTPTSITWSALPAEMIVYAALDPAIASKARKGDFVWCLDHFDLLQSPIN